MKLSIQTITLFNGDPGRKNKSHNQIKEIARGKNQLTPLSKTGLLSLTSAMVTLMTQTSSSGGLPLSVARTVMKASFSLDGSSRSKICKPP